MCRTVLLIDRLLLMDVDRWVHLNCALWSYEVFEAQDGTLFHVDKACRNGISVQCIVCHRRGATLSCFEPYCSKVYHLPCAIDDNVVFLADKVCYNYFIKLHFQFCLNNSFTADLLISLVVDL